jgi:hypothetical protein
MLAVAGAVVLWMGMKAKDSVAERARDALVGSYSDRTTLYLVGGGAALAGGLVLMVFGGGGSRRR